MNSSDIPIAFSLKIGYANNSIFYDTVRLEAKNETHEWKRVSSVQQGRDLIAAAEVMAKVVQEKKALGHAVTTIRTPPDVVTPLITTPRDTWIDGLGHGVTMAKKVSKPLPMRAVAEFCGDGEKASHRTPHVPPLYVASPTVQTTCIDGRGSYSRLTRNTARLFANLIN